MPQTIKRAFEEELCDYYKELIVNEWDRYGLDADLHLTRDDSFLFQLQKKWQDNEIMAVLSSGNATKTTTDTKIYTQGLSINFYVPINKKKQFINILNNYVHEHDDSEVVGIGEAVGTTYPYYCQFTYNTALVSGAVLTINGMQVIVISLVANITWCESDFDTNMVDEIKLNNTTLNQVYSVKHHYESILERYTSLGKEYQDAYENYKTSTYTISFILNTSDSLHAELLSNNYHQYSIKIGDVSFLGYVVIDYELVKNNFTAMTITIVR